MSDDTIARPSVQQARRQSRRSAEPAAQPSEEVAAPMRDEAAARPLVQLDPAGTPTVLSYNVPEPTSYSGKNYIALSQLPADAFSGIAVGANTEMSNRLAARPPSQDGLRHPGLVLDTSRDDGLVIRSATESMTDRLAALRTEDLRAALADGFAPIVVRGSGGLLDVQFLPQRPADPAGAGPSDDPGNLPVMLLPRNSDGPVDFPPFLSVTMTSPAPRAHVLGPAGGITFAVMGEWDAERIPPPSIQVTVDGQSPIAASLVAPGWRADVTINTGGPHRVEVVATAKSGTRKVTATDWADITVELAATGASAIVPSIRIENPPDRAVLFLPTGTGNVAISGTADSNVTGQAVDVEVRDVASGPPVTATIASGKGSWSVTLPLLGVGRHDLEIVARSGGVSSPPNMRSLVLSTTQPVRRLVSRLLIVETLALSSFLGAYGAGRVLRTFSLLPGERTTISVKTFTQTDETRKEAASILDSTASEASSEFDDAISREQSNKAGQSEASSYKVGAEASATWGWGSAKISAEFAGSANSAREEAVKNVKSATQKHASKASSNRSVTVNTDYEVRSQEKTEESTTREIANINVSRTLNFTFRQLNQEHIVLVHLTNVRIAFYAEDLLLDGDGLPMIENGSFKIRPTYQEVSLPELQDLLDARIVPAWHERIRNSIVNVLTGIPDYTDSLQTVVESATPTADGKPVPGAQYLRFPRNLSTTWSDPTGTNTFTVPGIVLSSDRITMRTDGVIVDALQGQGEALDSYNTALQYEAVESRRLANRQAAAALNREELAQKLVVDGNETAAAIFGRLFVPPPAVSDVKDLNDEV